MFRKLMCCLGFHHDKNGVIQTLIFPMYYADAPVTRFVGHCIYCKNNYMIGLNIAAPHELYNNPNIKWR